MSSAYQTYVSNLIDSGGDEPSVYDQADSYFNTPAPALAPISPQVASISPQDQTPYQSYLRSVWEQAPLLASGSGAEFNAVGNAFRVLSDDAAYWGGSGAPQPHAYYQYLDQTNDSIANGTWQRVNPGGHAEAANYFWAGLNTPQYGEAYQSNYNDAATALDLARLSQPDAIGQMSVRGDLVGLNPLGGAGAELAFYAPTTLSSTGVTLTPEQQAAANTQLSQSTPAAQDDGDGGFGDILAPLAMMAAIYFMGPAGAGLWGAEAGAGELAGATTSLTGNAALDSYISQLPTSLAKSTALQLIQGQDPNLESMLTGAALGGLNTLGATWLVDAIPGLDLTTAKQLIGTGTSLAMGADPTQLALNYGINAGTGALSQAASPLFSEFGEYLGLTQNANPAPVVDANPVPVNPDYSQAAMDAWIGADIPVYPESSAWNPGADQLPGWEGTINTAPYTPYVPTPEELQAAIDASKTPDLFVGYGGDAVGNSYPAMDTSGTLPGTPAYTGGTLQNAIDSAIKTGLTGALTDTPTAPTTTAPATTATSGTTTQQAGVNPLYWLGLAGLLGTQGTQSQQQTIIPRAEETTSPFAALDLNKGREELFGTRFEEGGSVMDDPNDYSISPPAEDPNNYGYDYSTTGPLYYDDWGTGSTASGDMAANPSASSTSVIDALRRLLSTKTTAGTSPLSALLRSTLGVESGTTGDALLSALLGGGSLAAKMYYANQANQAGQQALGNTMQRSPKFTEALAPRGGLAQAAPRSGLVRGASRHAAHGGAMYASGGTPGQSDKIHALLSDGEFVVDADTVAALGDGNNAAGASALEQMRQNVRRHKRSAPPTKIPPKAKRPEQYLRGAR